MQKLEYFFFRYIKVSLLRFDENASEFIGLAIFWLMTHAMKDPELSMSVIANPFKLPGLPMLQVIDEEPLQ